MLSPEFLARFKSRVQLATTRDTRRAPESYRDEPITFAKEVLGLNTWQGQDELLHAISQGDRVACASGHAIGKSAVAAAIALWFWWTRGPQARVILISPTWKQTNETLYNEVKNRLRNATHPLPQGTAVGQRVDTGLRAPDGRQILGASPENPVALQGIRSPEMLVIADESSGITDEMFDAINSLLAGGGKLILLGNPLRTVAPFSYFFQAFRKEGWETFQIPSTASPNVTEGRVVIPGLCTAEWIRDALISYGGESAALFKMRVLGEFVEVAEGRLFPPDMLMQAVARWDSTEGDGRLIIGVDPAMAQAGKGDSSGFVVRRGLKVITAFTRTGLNEDGHLAEILGICREHGTGAGDPPMVCVDRDGHVGARVYTHLSTFRMTDENTFHLRGVRGGERAAQFKVYDKKRHELYFNLVDAFNDGLAIPDHPRLLGELGIIQQELTHRTNLSCVQHKDDMRKALNGRSPDLADALALTCAAPKFDHWGG